MESHDFIEDFDSIKKFIENQKIGSKNASDLMFKQALSKSL